MIILSNEKFLLAMSVYIFLIFRLHIPWIFFGVVPCTKIQFLIFIFPFHRPGHEVKVDTNNLRESFSFPHKNTILLPFIFL